jgi:hypothetical protein
MLNENFDSKVQLAAQDAADILLKNKSDYTQEHFEKAIKGFARSINNFICTTEGVAQKEKLLRTSVTTLMNTIAEKCPFLTQRNDKDILVLSTENQRKIAQTVLNSDLSMFSDNVKNCLVEASVCHETKNGQTIDSSFVSEKLVKAKNPQYFANEQLLFSAVNGNNDDLKNLINKGADLHYRNERALMRAAELGKTEIVKLLVENGADFKLNNYEALRLSVKNNHIETSTYLINLDREKSLDTLKNLTYTPVEVIGELMNISLIYEESTKKAALKN